MNVEPLRTYELQLIATIIHQPEFRYMIFAQLQEKHFAKCRAYFNICDDLFKKSPKFDEFDVEQAIDNTNISQLPIGLSAESIFSDDQLEHRIQELQENYSKRHFSKLLRRATQEINDKDINDLLDLVNSVDIDSNTVEGANVPDTLEEIEGGEGDREPLITHNPVLNDMYESTQNHLGSTEVILADAKHGKTTYAIYKGSELAKSGNVGLYVILEDTRQNLALKFANQMHHSGEMENVHMVDIRDGVYNLQSIIHRIKYYKAKYKIKWVCVDYIQRVDVPGLSRFDKIETVSQKLTNLANEMDLFIMLLSQPHNISDQRKGYKRMPTVHDADGASAIRKDAFVVTGVFRPRLIEDLVIKDQGVEMFCKGFKGDQIPLNSVIVKQLIIRSGEVYTKPIMFEHKDQGLVLPTKREVESPF